MDITELLTFCIDRNASDLHISTGESPLIRVNGELKKVDLPIMNKKIVFNLLYDIMNDAQRKNFEENLETDFSFEIEKKARFRVNVYNQTRGPAGAFRLIPSKVKTLEELHMPKILQRLTSLPHGLILVTGPTGSGKSTTLAAMVEEINLNTSKHIITIEDPIEFLYENKKSLINQREVHRDTYSFKNALRSALREDPDVILVGEMRDLETIRLALSAAETGHLVLATLHTSSAAKTINRIVNVFPTGEKDMTRMMLSESLQAVIAQRLLHNVDDGRVAALEVMVGTHAIRNLIREDKIAQMVSTIQTGGQYGMQTMEQSIQFLLENDLINMSVAQQCLNQKDFFDKSSEQ